MITGRRKSGHRADRNAWVGGFETTVKVISMWRRGRRWRIWWSTIRNKEALESATANRNISEKSTHSWTLDFSDSSTGNSNWSGTERVSLVQHRRGRRRRWSMFRLGIGIRPACCLRRRWDWRCLPDWRCTAKDPRPAPNCSWGCTDGSSCARCTQSSPTD